ncbi:MAG TPA: TlpA family protein disulfide reductase [Candidatus Scybalomonas excrementigallinarum]|nr:TlpA family protein disulfide reductase [Candidatus Scybalomonas excrementigallinarum]
MKKKNSIILIVIIVLFATLLVGGNILYQKLSKQVEEQDQQKLQEEQEEQETSTTTEEELAMDFTVYGKDGEEIKLSHFQGKKPVVVNFWASWCDPCKEEMPYFQEAIEQYGDEVEFLMVNLTDGMRETVEKADKFIKESGYDMDIVYDLDLDATYTYYISSIPRTLFINRDGTLYYDYMGRITKEFLNSSIEKILEQS